MIYIFSIVFLFQFIFGLDLLVYAMFNGSKKDSIVGTFLMSISIIELLCYRSIESFILNIANTLSS